MKPTVAAVVVTFNRKQLLHQCLTALLNQSCPVDCIVVIDNASTDGTTEMLAENGYLHQSRLIYQKMSENTGGAGGFHEGMKLAFEAGYTWLWLMDDDGVPADTCLERLLINSEKYDVIGTAVVKPDDSEALALKLRVLDDQGYFANRQYISTYRDLCAQSQNGIYAGTANFFNGVLIHRRVPESIGYVLKELFIWGDEYEYSLRIKAANFQVATAVDAIYRHPASLFTFSKLKYYYYFRNLIYVYQNYAQIMYRPSLRWLFPIYTVANCLRMTPSWSPHYLARVLSAVFWAWQGKLIPYNWTST
ncbi:glycosyltransferase family 2 protein [Leptolyngbya sp. PCC 6406]|uniref:glycosyltransferase family 2 protein n=1 Tax=Leptolyngbya sp. PCC 6406 TaxID=1173264 RepID=UPI0002AC9BA5|nr:glycosyltransferase family 2 protein [Leptolyngbya sp. PCC 6406]